MPLQVNCQLWPCQLSACHACLLRIMVPLGGEWFIRSQKCSAPSWGVRQVPAPGAGTSLYLEYPKEGFLAGAPSVKGQVSFAEAEGDLDIDSCTLPCRPAPVLGKCQAAVPTVGSPSCPPAPERLSQSGQPDQNGRPGGANGQNGLTNCACLVFKLHICWLK